jgi:hypothetical protein
MVHTSSFAAGVAKIGPTFGVFVLPILKGKFGMPAVLGMVAAVKRSGSGRDFGLWSRGYGGLKRKKTDDRVVTALAEAP